MQYEVYCYFSGLKNKPIKKYSRNVLGESKQYIEEENQNLYAAIRQIWEATKHLSAKDLSDIARVEGSAWDKAFQASKPYLDGNDIMQDTTYYPALLKLNPEIFNLPIPNGWGTRS